MGDSDAKEPDRQDTPSASGYPVLAWEDAAHRVVLPHSLRLALGVNDRILRWARHKRELVIAQHANDAEVLQDIGQHIERWAYCGPERGRSDVWRVLFMVEARWYSLALGRDAMGSLNVITVFGSSSASFLRNRLRRMESVVERRRMTSGQGGGPGVS
jgi:hypothetical protein